MGEQTGGNWGEGGGGGGGGRGGGGGGGVEMTGGVGGNAQEGTVMGWVMNSARGALAGECDNRSVGRQQAPSGLAAASSSWCLMQTWTRMRAHSLKEKG
jgi:hypothetical protein